MLLTFIVKYIYKPYYKHKKQKLYETLVMIVCGVLLLSLVSCTTEIRKPNLHKERFHWKMLVKVNNKVDTAYFDDHVQSFICHCYHLELLFK
jgi:hypothetical protein